MTQDNSVNSLSSAPHGKLIDFEHAEIRSTQFNDEIYLYVAGAKPEDGWQAMLAPRIHHSVPDYADVEILKVRSRQDIKNSATENEDGYQLSIPINSIKGSKGIMLIGANGDKVIDI